MFRPDKSLYDGDGLVEHFTRVEGFGEDTIRWVSIVICPETSQVFEIHQQIIPENTGRQGSSMELYEAMSTLRAVRRLKSDPIPDDVQARVLNAATWAPTGGNVQPWRIIAVTDADKKQALEDLYRPHWESYIPGYESRMKNMSEKLKASTTRSLDAGTYLANHMHGVPLIAVFCFNPDIMTITDLDQPRTSVVGGGSVYPAVQNFLLACRNEGLGCVLTTLLCYEEPALKELLGIPDDWYTCAHVPVGYPVLGGHGSISRRGIDEMVSFNSWR